MDRGKPVPAPARRPTRSEILTDAVIHAIGIAAGFAGAITLIMIAIPHGDYAAIAAVAVYCTGLMAMWICSCVYNLCHASARRELLRCTDQSAIFAMIAGTYTPFTVLTMEGFWGLALTLIVWCVAGFGVAIRILRPDRFERISIGLYMALGWVGMLTVGPFLGSVPPSTLVLLAAGGLLYTAGVVFHLWEKLPFQTAIWHAFVLVAATCHYAAVYGTVAALESGL
jgi:hemolysin III